MSYLKRTTYLAGTASVVAALLCQPAHAIEGSWQLGVNAGVSRLAPDTDGSAFSLDDEQSVAASVYAGLDITPIISAEVAFSTLGEAGLSQNETIGYQAISIGATAYVLGEKETYNRSEGLSTYLRLGFSAIDNESTIELDKENNTAVWLAAGVQYPFSESWGLRAELASYDGDAQALLAGIYWRTGGGTSSNQSSAPAVARAPVIQTEPVTPAPSAQTEPAVTEPAPVRQPARSTTQSVAEPCPAIAQIPNAEDCLLLNGVVEALEFASSSAQLPPSSLGVLDRVAAALVRHPDVVVEIRAHTQALGSSELEASVAANRAKAVARYLVQQGIPVSQLRAKAFGARQPLPNSAAASQVNNRVELSTQ